MNLTESLVLLAVSVGLLIFGRGRNGAGLSFLSEITLGRGAAIRSNDIISFRCGPHGHRCKSELATLKRGHRTRTQYFKPAAA
jgi:hypothetical protein